MLLHALAHTLKQQKQQKDSTTSTSTATNSVPLPALRMSAKDINADPARFFGGTGYVCVYVCVCFYGSCDSRKG